MKKQRLPGLSDALRGAKVTSTLLKLRAARLGALVFFFASVQTMPVTSHAQETASSVEQAKSMAQANSPELVNIGREIYTKGVLPSGALLTGKRFGKTPIFGADAACVKCHRPSGMGQVEGDIQVSPINGNFLYATRKDKQIAIMDPRVSKLFNQSHDPYNDKSFAAAVNEGVNNQGREMNGVMPRYDLDEGDRKALTAYLSQLSAQWSPGVSETAIRFATVITPDVDQVQRKAFTDMMRIIVQQKNGSTLLANNQHTRHHMTSAAELILGTERKWELEFWELQGEPDTWGKQMEELYQKQPVFALLSGLSHSTWQPVHDFCDNEKVPCWFPSVDVPAKTQSQYAFYFSGGVILEADVLARHLLGAKKLPNHLVQIYRDDYVGRAAAEELSRLLEGTAIKVETAQWSPSLRWRGR